MALESATYIDGLVATNPAASDAISTADDHLRLIKSAIKATFPNITAAVTKTAAEINNLASQSDLDALETTVTGLVAGAAVVPSGGIIMWSGSIASIPSGWFLCDGTNGTPNLRDRFVVGAGSSYGVGATGGSKDAIVVSHSHTASSSVNDPGHSHSVERTQNLAGTGSSPLPTLNNYNASPVSTTSSTTGISVSTTVNSTGSSGTNANLPPYYALAYIMKA